LAASLFASCNNSSTNEETAGNETVSEMNAVAENPLRDAYFGNLHIHTSYSFDGFTNGCPTTPADAYRWAQGEAIPGGGGGPDLQIKVPLDWYAVSDHAEYMGVFKRMANPEDPLSKLPIAADITSKDQSVAFAAFAKVLEGMNKGIADPDLNKPEINKSVWKEIVETADKYNKPGTFTTFPAFEWTSAPNNRNLHRVVLFESSTNVPELPFSTLDSDKPEELWKYMDQARSNGAKLLAVPHNGNASDGMMFDANDSYGNPIDAAYSASRMKNEPLYEISQIKGTSEAHPSLSPNDEFAGFEIWDYTLSAITERPTKRQGSYVRQALRDGIVMESEGKGNPFKYGFIGDSDTHNSAASVEEDNYTGKFAFENNAEHRLNGPEGFEESNKQQVREFSSGGLAGVWAVSNTREAIFDAMVRKETFATSGPRMKVRFFAGYNFTSDALSNPEWLKSAYENGTPMGGTLSKSDGNAPTFIIEAVKETDGANLDRIQVIKGYVKDGKSYEKIYNVALSDNRVPDSKGMVAPVGNTVDPKTATYTNDIGAPALSVVWTDPEFDAALNAFYYVRVLQIPTPRWSTYDAMKLGIEPRKDLPVSIQERAWTSPIWYNPQ